MPSATVATQGGGVKELSPNFGILIAFVLPGLVALWGIGYHAPSFVHGWFQSPDTNAFLFAVLVSLAIGVFVSGLRWLLFDQLVSRWFGLSRPQTDYRRITSTEQGMKALAFSIEHTYRHYQFYSNMAVALVLAYVARATAGAVGVVHSCGQEVVGASLLVLIVASLTLSARDCLKRYYSDLADLNRE